MVLIIIIASVCDNDDDDVSLSATTVAIFFVNQNWFVSQLSIVFFFWFVRKKKHIRYSMIAQAFILVVYIFIFLLQFFFLIGRHSSPCVYIPVLKIHKEIHFEIDLFFCYHLPLLLLISVIVVVKIQKTDWRLQAIFFVLFIRNIKKKNLLPLSFLKNNNKY